MKKLSFMVALVAMALSGCGGADTQEKTGPKNVKPLDVDVIDNFDSASSAQITFDELMHNFGSLSAGEQVSYSFHFRNTGKKDLVISSCSASCGCTVPSYPKGRIAPGEDGYLTVSFNSSGKYGDTYETVTVVSNAQPGRQTLQIVARVGY